ncbi:hypothetical protein M902_0321 [Bacteriovorax sp. BAL6_X]|uniref:hypothetical protein n=1 Tax=Bacteriovorax sp. BAL6_X TaxID=1201290 RepID=UPI0003862DC1|nr:hypothetical protein [Bacteriovorax sp. BAL6_X]EPZ49547.1 hypothetical protein M902_0321 [Bacteriovorax sp. BAL6_X]
MGVKKYTHLYKGADSRENAAPTTSQTRNQQKKEVEQLQELIQKRLENPQEAKKAARIIEQMLKG